MKSKEYFARDLYAKADTAPFTFHLSVFTSLAARPNFLSEGVRYNVRQKGLRWAVLGRTAHCRHLLLAEVDDPLSQERTNFLSEGVRFGDLSQTEKAEFTERK